LSALSWCAPQSAHGLYALLKRDGKSCSECKLDYTPYLKDAFRKVRGWIVRLPRSYFIERYIRAFRRLVPYELRPEVDHIKAVCFGGQSIGLDNVRILCNKCHKAKTKLDNKARFEALGSPLKGLKRTEECKRKMSKYRQGFDSLARKAHREKIYATARIPIIAINLITKEERVFQSIREAGKELNLQESNIGRVLSGRQNRTQHKGWTFKLACPACTGTGMIHKNCILR